MAKYSSSMRQTEWFSQVREWPFVKAFISLIRNGLGVFVLFLISQNAYAADMSTVLANLRKTIVPLTALALVVCFVIGMGLIFNALTKMKKFGMMQSMMTQPGEMGGPLVSLIVGAMLIYLPTSTDFLMNTLFQSHGTFLTGGGQGINYQAMGYGSSLLSYSGSAGLGQHWADLANTLVLFIQFIGFLSFIKGFLLIQKSAQPSHQPGTFSKGLTHLLGGVVLINFIGAVNILKNTVYGG